MEALKPHDVLIVLEAKLAVGFPAATGSGARR
jgi:hypothetical protein